MLTRTALALLLALPAVAFAQGQDLETALSAVVRISGTREGVPVRGTGFVVGLETGKATIVTAAHVIEGVQQLAVTFAGNTTEHFPAGDVLGMDAGSPNGLAVFQVRGAIPSGVTILSFEAEIRPSNGDDLFLVGFPEMDLAPRTPRRVLSGRRGTLLLIDQGIGEGFSGGPVLRGGKVVGVVTDADDQTTYAVSAVVVHEALEGWGAPLGCQKTKRETSSGESCWPGEERTERGVIFVRICPGAFTMGSTENDPQADGNETPAHEVTLSEFWIGKTEIANEQYRLFRSAHQGDAGLPATNISWIEAKEACEHFGGRLPTEAEWEYAARAASQTAWSFGDDEKMLRRYAWYGESLDGAPHPVGLKKPNLWGLHDMHGNVLEWVADWYGTYPVVAQSDPSGPKAGESRVLRGGAFSFSPKGLRSAFRYWFPPEKRFSYVGFRCVRSLGRQP